MVIGLETPTWIFTRLGFLFYPRVMRIQACLPHHVLLSALGRFGLFALILLTLLHCRPLPSEDPQDTSSISAVEALASGEIEGYARALEPRPLLFPEDHGPHPEFKTEWWYFTGHLDGEDRRFGYQLTFFRSALAPTEKERASEWSSRQLYLAHFALSDIDGDRFHAFERFSRGAAGLAGAQADPFQVWLDDWRVESVQGGDFPWKLTARAEDDAGKAVELSLDLNSLKPMVLHGDRGLSQKGQEPGNASFYYSFTRMASAGTVRLGDRVLPVTGSSWLDREWSTSVLTEEQTGWDWFSLQLDDGREMMYFQLRLKDGGVEPASHGTFVQEDGSYRYLELDDVDLEVLDTWTSESGVTYPAAWRLRMEDEGLDLELRPLLADQELEVSFRYWEGAIEVEGTGRGEPIRGRGYVELVGYPSNS